MAPEKVAASTPALTLLGELRAGSDIETASIVSEIPMDEALEIEAAERLGAYVDIEAIQPPIFVQDGRLYIAIRGVEDAAAAEWAQAEAAYVDARKAEIAYDEGVWTPAFDASPPIPVPQAVSAEMERLQSVRIDAEDAMMDTPAPSVSAVLRKIEAARWRWDGFEWGDEVWAPIIADLQAFAGLDAAMEASDAASQ